jgi:NTP pyrophosphatase (non-canonical NTP hydrolase)
MSYAEVEMKVLRWSEARKIIPNSTPAAQFKKLQEEIAELHEAMANNDMVEVVDGIGDSVVCLINICALYDINLTDCLESAYEQIKDRKGSMNAEGLFVKETV